MPEKLDIYSKIFYMDVEKFVRHLCRLVLRHQMPVWNYFVNSFYSAPTPLSLQLVCPPPFWNQRWGGGATLACG